MAKGAAQKTEISPQRGTVTRKKSVTVNQETARKPSTATNKSSLPAKSNATRRTTRHAESNVSGTTTDISKNTSVPKNMSLPSKLAPPRESIPKKGNVTEATRDYRLSDPSTAAPVSNTNSANRKKVNFVGVAHPLPTGQYLLVLLSPMTLSLDKFD